MPVYNITDSSVRKVCLCEDSIEGIDKAHTLLKDWAKRFNVKIDHFESERNPVWIEGALVRFQRGVCLFGYTKDSNIKTGEKNE